MKHTDISTAHHRAQTFLAGSTVAVMLQQSTVLEERCLAIASTYTQQPSAVTAGILAQLARQLIAHEITPGGPYRSHADQHNSFINAAVGYLMQHLGQPLPNIQTFLREAIQKQSLQGRVIPEVSLYLTTYALTPDDQPHIATYVQTLLPTQSPVRAALLLAVQHQIGSQLDSAALQAVLRHQRADGSWPSETTGLSADSSALTTALIAEALHSLLPASHRSKQAQEQRYIFTRAQAACHSQPTALRQRMHDGLEYVMVADRNKEIALLSRFFAAALASSPPEVLVQTLGVANVFCWLAYTIYDDIVDEEPQAGRYLPTANSALRQAFLYYQEAGCDPQLIQTAYTLMDNANTWELAHCRFTVEKHTITIGTLPRYGNRRILAHRAWGHAIGPLAILQSQGYSTASKQFRAVTRGLQHYLIARQLNDDMHDWQSDLQQGQASFIVTDMLRGLAVVPGEYTITPLISRMKRHFLLQGFQRHNTLIMSHVQAARQAYHQSGIITHGEFTALLDTIESSVHKAQANLRSAKKMLKQFATV